MSSKVYTAFVNKIQKQINQVQQEVSLLEEINLLNFFSLTFQQVLYPAKTQKLLAQIDEIYNQLNQLRGKVKSALNTYANVKQLEDQEHEIEFETDDSNKSAFLSDLLSLLEQINFIEHELERKDLRYFINKKNNQISEFEQSFEDKENIDWKDLNIKF
ncbi:MAG: hypothetical protein AAGE84_07400 [Cyanobacteria bacterium P01_G01_bin.39]